MSALLACRVELSKRANLELDALLLEWLSTMPEIGRTEMWLRHSYGLVGNLTGAVRLLDDLFPFATWFVASAPEGGTLVMEAGVIPVGTFNIFKARGPVPANALIAAILRAHQGTRVKQPVEQRA